MWIKCGDGTHLLNANQVLQFSIEAAQPRQDGGPSRTDCDLPHSGVLVLAWLPGGVRVPVGCYDTEEHAALVLTTIAASFESGARTLDVHRLRTRRRGAEGG